MGIHNQSLEFWHEMTNDVAANDSRCLLAVSPHAWFNDSLLFDPPRTRIYRAMRGTTMINLQLFLLAFRRGISVTNGSPMLMPIPWNW